jgi:hypothetical protein
VLGVARFSAAGLAEDLKRHGIVPIACDLLDREAVGRLPDAPNVIFMAGQKFGTSDGPEQTWAMNTIVPANCAERYGKSRIVAFSTGCVYPLVPVDGGGATEEVEPAPPGDYANSCVGRERIMTYFSRKNATPVAIFRLNYAVETRYGVLVDLAQSILRGDPVDLTMGYVNVIWQRDANARAIQCLSHASSPPFVINVTGAEVLRLRDLVRKMGLALGVKARVTGVEAATAWITNASRSFDLFGPVSVSVDEMIGRVAEWAKRGGTTLGKPTHFQTRNGRF